MEFNIINKKEVLSSPNIVQEIIEPLVENREEAKKKAAKEAKKKAAKEAKKKAAKEAKKKAAKEAKKKAAKEAKKKAAKEAKKKAAKEAKKKAAKEVKVDKKELEIKRKAEEERRKIEEITKRKAEEERRKADEERRKIEEIAKRKAEEERRKAEEERRKAAEVARLNGLRNKYINSIRTKIDRNKKYPLISKAKKEEGTVLISFRIDRNGKITNIKIIRSSGFEKLDKSAFKAVSKIGIFRKMPEGLNNKFLDIQVPIKFNLN